MVGRNDSAVGYILWYRSLSGRPKDWRLAACLGCQSNSRSRNRDRGMSPHVLADLRYLSLYYYYYYNKSYGFRVYHTPQCLYEKCPVIPNSSSDRSNYHLSSLQKSHPTARRGAALGKGPDCRQIHRRARCYWPYWAGNVDNVYYTCF
jgi:hypothetical protein